MSDQDFFQDLESRWQQEDSLPEMNVSQAMAARRRQKLNSAAYFILSLLSLLIAGWFLSFSFSPVLTGAGVTLITAVVVDWVYAWRFRRPISRWEDWSMEGLLHYRMALLEAEMRNARYYRFSAIGLLAFTAFLWILVASGMEFRVAGFHQLFSAIAIPVSLFVMIYFGRGREEKLRRRETLTKLIADFDNEN